MRVLDKDWQQYIRKIFQFLQFRPEKTAAYPFPERDYSLRSVGEQVVKEKWEKQKKLDQELMERGYNRVLEKINNKSLPIMQWLSPQGRRRGSGKILMEFYVDLIKLCDGSPATKTWTLGVQ